MATLAPGILLKLLDGMSAGTAKPVGEHRTALLQITDIVPADLDEKDLWPKQGFYIKVSDSSHSIYVSLPFDQDELVLSNKMQLGQFVHVDRLDPGSPVPVIKGAKLLPGRHPLVGTPEPIVRAKGKCEGSSSRGSAAAKATKICRRGSWEQNCGFGVGAGATTSPSVVKKTALAFECGTPARRGRSANQQNSPTVREKKSGRQGNSGLVCRSSVNEALLPKLLLDSKVDGSALRKSCSLPKFHRSKSVCGREARIPRSPFSSEKNKATAAAATTSPARDMRRTEAFSPMNGASEKWKPVFGAQRQPLYQPSGGAAPKGNASHRLPLPGKLGLLGKEVVQQKEAAQRAALQALRDASAAETLVRLLRVFSELSSSAKAEDPASCLDQFLIFHQEIVQAVADLETIQAATSNADKRPNPKQQSEEEEEEEEDSSVLHEIPHNVNANDRRAMTTTTTTTAKPSRKGAEAAATTTTGGGNRAQNYSSSSFSNSIKLAKQLQTEAGIWFMEFLDAALESGLKKPRRGSAADDGRQKECRCPQSLILKVINWVEVEQSDGSKRPVHPRATHVARKLRIKVKNPHI